MKASALALLLCACATTGPAAPSQPTGVEAWFPLTAGNAWSYDADGTLVIVRVRARDGNRADMGDFAYEIRDDGIVRLPQGKYVLQKPLTVGHEWPLPGGGRARISSADDERLVVEERDGAGTRTLTTFERGTGPVDVLVQSGGAVTHARLRGFTKAGQEI